MNRFEKIWDKLFIKQWTIGIAKASDNNILDCNFENLNFHWFNINKKSVFYADPFVHSHENGNHYIFFENYSYYIGYGKISVLIIDNFFNIINFVDILDTKSHLSYPFVFCQEGKVFIMPESSKEKKGDQYAYEYDFESNKLINKKTVVPNKKLLDATIFKHKDKYWLFSTQRGKESNSNLNIFFSDHWDFGYISHSCNPVKTSAKGSRPAGSMMLINGMIYRPTQNCEDYYGKSIIINKIETLNPHEFIEIPVKEIFAPKNSEYNYAIHTINFSNDVIVIDGLRRIFNPLEQIKIYIAKKFFRN